MLSQWQQETADYISAHMPNMNSYHHRDKLLDKCVRDTIPGLALEFGVGVGTTLRRIARKRYVYGFDSFEGLPEYWREDYPAGTCKVDDIPTISNAQLIMGWFEDTLPQFLKEHPEPATFVHIDSDLYSSAKTILDNANITKGTQIVFDEYFNYPGWQDGEHKALMEASFDWKYIGYSFNPPDNDGQHVAIQVV